MDILGEANTKTLAELTIGVIFGVAALRSQFSLRAATGNLRAVISGLVFSIFAQMSSHGLLSPLRNSLASLWITPADAM